jgi:hypothetical protein
MPAAVYLIGSDQPAWVADHPDVFVSKVEDARSDALLAVTGLDVDEDEYSEHTAYIRADQVAYVRPLPREDRERVAEARA